MRFEKFLLYNYIATQEGQKIYRLFSEWPTLIEKGDHNGTVIRFINNLLHRPIPKDFFNLDGLEEIDNDSHTNNGRQNENFTENEYIEESKFTFDIFEKYIYSDITSIMQDTGYTWREMLGEIPNISLAFFYDYPKYAFPYLYPMHFNILQEIFYEFQIYLPAIPGRTQHQARCLYYIQLCRSLYEFRMKHGLTPEELCVFIYGFGRKFITQPLSENLLPTPNKAWLIGAGEGDTIATLDNLTPDSIEIWMGIKDMRIGDLVFMYERSPNKRIQYAMRILSEFYDDPFHYYAGKIYIGQAQKIPPITFDDLKNNPVMSKNGFVRASMQGVGSRGPSLQAKEYNALLDMISIKGYDITNLPQLMSHSMQTQIEINNERDVELHLLEPLLRQFGLTDKNITRQMPLRMGRGVRYYPDYVINAKTTRGEEQGTFIWEAKYRIANNLQMIEALYQAKSYALRLSANGLGLASYEGIWLSFAKDQFSPEKIQHYTWQMLVNVDNFAHISSLLKNAFGRIVASTQDGGR